MKIPQDNKWTQENRSDLYGVLRGSFNIDLQSNKGKVRVTRTKLASSSDGGNFELNTPYAFDYYFGKYYAITSGGVFKGGDVPSDAWAVDTNGTAGSRFSDFEQFNGALYVSLNQSIDKLATSGGSWTTVTSSLSNGDAHPMAQYGNRLYVAGNNDTIYSLNTSDTLATSSTYTCDLQLSTRFAITGLVAGRNRLWISVMNIAGQPGYVYEWDGVTANTPNNRYSIDGSIGPIAITMRNNVPYILTAEGKLMTFNGAGFEELARFPADKLADAATLDEDRWCHHNGMKTSDEGEILMLVRGTENNSSTETSRNLYEYMPSGVWAWTPETGLYHKYSLSYSATGGTTVTDFGQMRIKQPGGLFVQKTQSQSPSSTDNGSILMGASYYTNQSTVNYGIFTNDTLKTTQKWGYIITSEIFASQVTETWIKLYARFQKLLDSSDKIIVRYRTSHDTPTEVTGAWVNTTTFNTTDDLSGYSVGDEFEATQGTGSGMSATITNIDTSSGTYSLTLDETFTGASGTAKGRVTKWKKAGSYNSQLNQYHDFPIGVTDTKVQLKVCMLFTGKDELEELILVNKTGTEAK